MASYLFVRRLGIATLCLGALQASCAGQAEDSEERTPPLGSGGAASGGTNSGGASSGGAIEAPSGGTPYNATGGTSYLTADYCFELDEVGVCPDEDSWGTEPGPSSLLDATMWGADARFVGLDGTAAWLELSNQAGSGRYRVVNVNPGVSSEDRVEVYELDWPNASRDVELRHAWAGSTWFQDPPFDIGRVSALACDEETCLVLSNSSESDRLLPVLRTELPLDTDRLSFAHGVPCVFGGRALCWDGDRFSTVLEIPEGEGSRFTAFARRPAQEGGPDLGIAVTDAGAVFLTDARGDFRIVVPAGSELGPVASVGFSGWEFSVLFESGDWWLGEPGRSVPPPTMSQCFEPDQLRFLSFPSTSSLQAVDAAGNRYLRTWHYENALEPGFRWCRSASDPVPGLLDVSVTACGLAHNVLGITATELIALSGAPTCPIG